jgi:ribosomal protein L11 methylase PrmA
VRDLLRQISTFLHANVDWIGQPLGPGLRILDYACGSGILSMVIRRHHLTTYLGRQVLRPAN